MTRSGSRLPEHRIGENSGTRNGNDRDQGSPSSVRLTVIGHSCGETVGRRRSQPQPGPGLGQSFGPFRSSRGACDKHQDPRTKISEQLRSRDWTLAKSVLVPVLCLSRANESRSCIVEATTARHWQQLIRSLACKFAKARYCTL